MKSFKLATLTVALSAIALTQVGCGQQKFAVATSTADAQSPGYFQIPAKVDFLLVQDNTTSILPAFDQIPGQMQNFLSSLDQQGWDYRFTSVPLVVATGLPVPITQVTASKYDANWNAYSQFKASYPGAPTDPNNGMYVLPSLFRTVFSFLDRSATNIANGKDEPALDTITRALNTAKAGSVGFLRPDAALVVFVVTNGQDTSGVKFCTRSDGYVGICEDIGMSGTYSSSLNTYINSLKAIKPSIQFFAAASPSKTPNCQGGSADAGTRYASVAAALNGQMFDICQQPLTTILGAISSTLTSQRLSMTTRYLVINTEADPSTIVVTKYPNGDKSKGVVIAKDSVNGWSYTPGQQTVNTIEVNTGTGITYLNQVTGYVVKLNGSSALVGEDLADVSFKQAGLKAN